MQIIPLNLDSVLLLLHNSKPAHYNFFEHSMSFQTVKINFLVQRRFLLWKCMMSCCAQQCCDMLQWNAAIVWPGLEFLRNINIKILNPGQTIATYQLNMSQYEKWSTTNMSQHIAKRLPNINTNPSRKWSFTKTLFKICARLLAVLPRCKSILNSGFAKLAWEIQQTDWSTANKPV